MATLLIMAAGLGSRYGGLKQLDPMTPHGEFIIDFSVFDAIRAGFDHVVFVIKKENYDVFRETIGARIESKVKVLSGGEQAKVRLCKLINRETNILLLDEPTNHLDVDAKEELKRALKAYKGSVLMVCHEPEFYEGLATDVWDCREWTTKVF